MCGVGSDLDFASRWRSSRPAMEARQEAGGLYQDAPKDREKTRETGAGVVTKAVRGREVNVLRGL